MQINFILFKVYIEPYRKWSNLKVKHDKPKKEYIIDYGYWRIFIYWLLCLMNMNLVVYRVI